MGGGVPGDRQNANEQFLAKAPAEVVEKIRGRRAAAEADVSRLTAALEHLPAG